MSTGQATQQKPMDAGTVATDGKKVRSFGNKAFDWVVWPTVQWAGVWSFSLYLADQIKNGIGKNTYEKAFNWLTPKFKPLAENKIAKKIWNGSEQEWAGATILIAALSLGGTLLIPITKFFEDRRGKISAWLDKTFDKSPVDPDMIKEEPKQTWWSLVKGRLASIGIAYGIFAVMGPHHLNTVQDKVGGAATNLFMKMRPGTSEASRAKINEWANLAVFDLFLTAMSATVTYASSRLFARKGTLQNDVIVPFGGDEEPHSLRDEEMQPEQAISATSRIMQKGRQYTEQHPQPANWVEGQENRKSMAASASL